MIEYLPALNATLNFTSAILLVTGRYFIKQGNRELHKKCMMLTFGVSVLFLISYITYHAVHRLTTFQGQGLIRPVYFTILTSHTILAAVIVPMAIITLRRGLKNSFILHRAIAKWTFPIWLYVSITGVVVYMMLYHLYPSG